LATAVSHAAGLRGTPSAGHCFSASMSDSCARSSARPKSPTMRVSVATILADSIRQTAAMVRSTLIVERTTPLPAGSLTSPLLALRLLFAPALFFLDPVVVGREVFDS